MLTQVYRYKNIKPIEISRSLNFLRVLDKDFGSMKGGLLFCKQTNKHLIDFNVIVALLFNADCVKIRVNVNGQSGRDTGPVCLTNSHHVSLITTLTHNLMTTRHHFKVILHKVPDNICFAWSARIKGIAKEVKRYSVGKSFIL